MNELQLIKKKTVKLTLTLIGLLIALIAKLWMNAL